MLMEVSGPTLDKWVEYYNLEPWDVPREYWPDIKRGNKPVTNDGKPRRKRPIDQFKFFEGLIAAGKVIDNRKVRTPIA